MRRIRWFAALSAVVLVVLTAACSDDDGGDDGSSDAPPSVLTATAIASDPTPGPSSDASSGNPAVGEYDGDNATDFLDFVLLKPSDITSPDWVVQSDATTDNEAAAAADPENAPLIKSCGRLLSRVITNFPPDSVAAFFDGTTLAYFSQGTLYETPEGAEDCAAAAGARLADCPALARTFGEVFTNPDGVICEPVSYEAVGEGSSSWKLTGQTDASGTEIGLTILVVSFRDDAATYAVGMAVSGIEPPIDELRPYVDLVWSGLKRHNSRSRSTMTDHKFKVDVEGSGKISAVRSEASKRGKWTLVYAPGAGSNINDPFGAFAASELSARGITVVRFQFPYMEAGKSGPDRPPVLEATWRAVMDAVREPRRKLVVGGRSMGGRIASQAVAQGAQADAVALFAYPLHPPGNPAKMRTEHLPALKLPTLFVSGTRDSFGAPDEIKVAAKMVKGSRVHLLEGADHGFSVKKSSGRTKDDVFAEAVDGFATWLLALK